MKINTSLTRAPGLRATFIAAILTLLTPLAAIAADSITIQHAQGKTTLKSVPQKVVVFDLAALDILDMLGVEATAVAGNLFPDHLSRYAQDSYPKVGTLFEPDYEAIHALSPDLIVVGGRSADKYRNLSRLAPTIDLTVDPSDLLGSIARNTRTLASIYGKEEQADALLARLDESVQALRAQTAGVESGLVILTVGGKLSAYGPGSRFGLIHDGFGLPAAVDNLTATNHGQAISFEFVYKNNPQWLFVIDRDAAIGREGSSAQQLLDNELIHKTTAWQKNQIVYLNAANWYLLGSAGPQALLKNIEQLSQALDQRQ